MESVQSEETGQATSIHRTEDVFNTLEELYHASQCFVANAIRAQNGRNNSLAEQQFMSALQCLEKGVSIDVRSLNDDAYSAAQEMQLKMAPVMEEVRSRLYKLQEVPLTSGSSAPGYSREVPEGHSSVPTAPIETNDDHLGNVREALSHRRSWLDETSNEKATELLRIPDGVQMFTVEEDMEVNSPPPSYPTSLHVCLFDNQTSPTPSRPPAFIQVEDWVYPLIPGQSPVLHCSNGAYIFPDLNGSSQGRSVGLVFSSTLDSSLEEAFSCILSNLACLQIQEHRLEGEPDINLSSSIGSSLHDSQQERECEHPKSDEEKSKEQEKKRNDVKDADEPSTSQKIASGIETSANWLSWGLSKGAQMTSSLIQRGATQLQENITPDEKPLSVNPTLQKGIYYTHEASKVAVQVSNAVIKGLCVVAGELAKIVSPHINYYLSSPASEKTGLPDDKESCKESNMSGVLTVAGAGLSGFSTVWKGLEQSGMAIAKSVSTATTDTVQHKYGHEAAQVTSQAMGSVVNLGRAMHGVDNMMIYALVDRTEDGPKEDAKDDEDKAGTSNDAENDILKQFCGSPARSK